VRNGALFVLDTLRSTAVLISQHPHSCALCGSNDCIRLVPGEDVARRILPTAHRSETALLHLAGNHDHDLVARGQRRTRGSDGSRVAAAS
jgi:hypothetical protein